MSSERPPAAATSALRPTVEATPVSEFTTSMRLRRVGGQVLDYALVALVVAIWFFPIYWIGNMSLKSEIELGAVPPTFVPERPSFESYYRLLFVLGFDRYFFNSVIVAAGSTAIGLFAGSLCAYSLSRYRFPWRLNYWLLFLILAVRMFPPTVTLVPLFIFFRDLHLLDTAIAVILAQVYFDLPFIVWMMRGFFADIPVDLEEAALVFGCDRFGAFRQVVLPMSLPGVAASSIFTFVLSWNEILAASVLKLDVRTLPAQVLVSLRHSPLAYQFAGGFALVVPALLFILVMRRYLLNMWGSTIR
jgi:multiple sugar transport system permease protein